MTGSFADAPQGSVTAPELGEAPDSLPNVPATNAPDTAPKLPASSASLRMSPCDGPCASARLTPREKSRNLSFSGAGACRHSAVLLRADDSCIRQTPRSVDLIGPDGAPDGGETCLALCFSTPERGSGDEENDENGSCDEKKPCSRVSTLFLTRPVMPLGSVALSL